MPDGIRTCDNEMDMVRHIEMKAGDVLLFLASAPNPRGVPVDGGTEPPDDFLPVPVTESVCTLGGRLAIISV